MKLYLQIYALYTGWQAERETHPHAHAHTHIHKHTHAPTFCMLSLTSLSLRSGNFCLRWMKSCMCGMLRVSAERRAPSMLRPRPSPRAALLLLLLLRQQPRPRNSLLPDTWHWQRNLGVLPLLLFLSSSLALSLSLLFFPPPPSPPQRSDGGTRSHTRQVMLAFRWVKGHLLLRSP